MKTIVKKIEIKAPMHIVHEVLTKKEHIERWSGSPATMDLNHEFSLWNGEIHGHNEIANTHYLEQQWKVEKWDTFSKVCIDLQALNDETLLTMIQTKIPVNDISDLAHGWDIYYLMPLKALAEEYALNK